MTANIVSWGNSTRLKLVFVFVTVFLLTIPLLTIASSEFLYDSATDSYNIQDAAAAAGYFQALEEPSQGIVKTIVSGDSGIPLSSDVSLETTVVASAYEGITPFATATAELIKVLVTPADEPTPDLTFRFNIVPHSFNGQTGLVGQVPQIGTGYTYLNINATNGSPVTAGGTTTLRRSVDILADTSFALPLPVGVYVWHIYEVEDSSGVNALAGRSSVDYSPAVYALTASVTGTTAATRAVAITFAAVESDLYAPVGAPMYSWGANATGQLGLGNTTAQSRPTRAGTADNWVALSSAGNGSAAINAEGHLYVWGNARDHFSMGRGGVGGAGLIMSPERIFMPTEVEADSATHLSWKMIDVAGTTNGMRMLAVTADGQLWAWGMNASGQLGDGTTTNRSTPVRIMPTHAWSTVSTVSFQYGTAGLRTCFTLAITEDGHLYSWGNNRSSQLGRATAGIPANTGVPTPARVNTASTGTNTWVTARAAGDAMAFAIGTNGQLYSWGNNSGDQLGRAGGTTNIPTPTLAGNPGATGDTGMPNPPVANWVDVVQQVNSPQVTVALTDDGRIFSWSGGTSSPVAGLGRPGGGTASLTRTNRPMQIGTASDWVYIGGGNAHSVAINSAGRLYTWGANVSGQLGNGTSGAATATNVPGFILQTFGLEGISQTGSGAHSMALIRTDPMTFTNVYTVTHPDYITLRADLTKALRELTQTPPQTNSPLSFTFDIERYSFNGSTAAAQVANLPALGITPFAAGSYTLSAAMNHANVTASHAGGATTLTRVIDILANAEFDSPGIYVWRVTENDGSSGVSSPAHMNYSQAVYYLTATVTEAAGTLTGTVTVVADVPDAEMGSTPRMFFTNIHTRTSSLSASKTATGGSIPVGQEFPFNVLMTRSAVCPATTNFAGRVYTVTEGPGPSTFVRAEVFEHNVARSINLLADQYIVFGTIAEGSGFNITETVPPNFSGSIALTVGGTVIAPPVPPVNVDDTNRSLSTGNRVVGIGTNSAAFANVYHWEIPTGLSIDNGSTWIVVVVAAAISLGAIVATKSALQGPVVASNVTMGQSAVTAGRALSRRLESAALRMFGR